MNRSKMTSGVVWLPISFVLLLLLADAGCTVPAPGSTGAVEADLGLPPVRINLPTPPRIIKPAIPQVYADGTLSVYGLRQAGTSYLDREIKVRGVVSDVYVCPWAEEEAREERAAERARQAGIRLTPAKPTHPPCKEPYFFMSDGQHSKQKLLVVGYNPQSKEKGQKPPEKGQEIVAIGKYLHQSDEGFMSPEGLLVLTAWQPWIANDPSIQTR